MRRLDKYLVGACLLGALSLMVLGCRSGHVPNPNDPADVGPLSPDTVRRNLGAITDALDERRRSGEIDERKYRELVEKAASELSGEGDPAKIKPDQAWKYGEVLRDAHQWKLADRVLRSAVAYAKQTHNDDRWVNDSLRLATVLAHENKIPEAIAMARSVFGAPSTQTAPILLATYLELVPAAQNKGHDLELGHLVEDAIQVHLKTKVDPKTDAGKTFLEVRPVHVRRAYETAAVLYSRAGRADLAKAAMAKAEGSRQTFA